MKLLKFIFVLFITVSITSCGGSDDTPEFVLSAVNLSGSYEMKSLSAKESEDATSSSGSSVNLTNTSVVGDTFQLNLVLNVNSTYTASGQYRIVSTITPNGGTPSEENEIIVVDASGSYQLDTTNNTITFIPQNGDFFEGKFNFKTFNETSIILGQEEVEVDGSITYTTDLSVEFTKK